MAALTGFTMAGQPPSASPTQWAAFAYLGLVSMFLGYFAWYRGLALGPMAQVSQTQLIQPVLSLFWAWPLLGEGLSWATLLGGAAVILCAGTAVRIRRSPQATR
jgi:drug/metabolite transporter (DMT)-like permease